MAGNGPRKSAAAGTKKRSAAEYIQEVRDYVAEHGRPPCYSSRLKGTAGHKLRRKVQLLVKKGRFSEEERRELAQLFERRAPAGGSAMAGNGPRKSRHLLQGRRRTAAVTCCRGDAARQRGPASAPGPDPSESFSARGENTFAKPPGFVCLRPQAFTQ